MTTEIFAALVAAVSLVAGAIASVAGFGIGSLLTPVLALEGGMKAAIAAVAIPHVAGTGLRLWWLRRSIDRPTIRSFGLASAGGGLVGALLHGAASRPSVGVVFALLLVAAGTSGIVGLAERVTLQGRTAWVAGAISGLFGGIAGNQGGVRSAALLGLGLQRDAFVATATGVALIVDVVRLPVYVATSGAEMMALAPVIGIGTAGVLVGTFAGTRLLSRIPEAIFRRVVSAVILLLGLMLLVSAL